MAVSLNGRRHYAHRLVLEAFVGPCPAGMEACHNDDNRADNRLCNLRWDTHAANCAERRRSYGSSNPACRLAAGDIAAIRERRARGERLRTLALDFGVSEAHISNIAHGLVRRHG